MKKLLSCLLVVAFFSVIAMFIFPQGVTKPKVQPTRTPYALYFPSPSPAPTALPLSPFAEHVFTVFSETEELRFSIREYPEITDEKCSFGLYPVDDHTRDGDVYIEEDKESFSIHFDTMYNDPSAQLIKDAVVAALLTIDSSLTCEEARDIASPLYLSYSKSACSELISHNGYAFVFVPAFMSICFYACNLSFYLPADFDTSIYREAEKGEIKSPLSEGEKFHVLALAGTTVNTAHMSARFLYYVNTVTDQGENIIMAFYPERVPFSCEIGKSYDFYGYVSRATSGSPVLTVDYCVPCDE